MAEPDNDYQTRWEHAHSNLVRYQFFHGKSIVFFFIPNVDLNFHLQTFMETHTMRERARLLRNM